MIKRSWKKREGYLPLWSWGIISYVTVVGLGSVNHDLGKWIGFVLFSPKDESVFQHSRMIVLPWIVFLFLYHTWQAEYRYYDFVLPKNKLSGAISLVFQCWCVVGFYYFFCEFNIHGLWLDIVNFSVTTLFGFIIWIIIGRFEIPIGVDFIGSMIVIIPLFFHQLFCTYDECQGVMFEDWSKILNGSYCAEDRWA